MIIEFYQLEAMKMTSLDSNQGKLVIENPQKLCFSLARKELMLILVVIVFFSRLLKVKYLHVLQFLRSLFYFKSDMNFLDTDEVYVNNSSFCVIG